MPSRPWLIAIFFAALVVALPAHHAQATGPVLTPGDGLTTVDLELAVAVTPFGSARWARLTVEGAPRVMWLVPARPGATLDWAVNSWLDALEDASTPRISPPDDSPPCGLPQDADRAPAWAAVGARLAPRALTVHAAESQLRDYIMERGYSISPGASAKISEAFMAGEALVAVELETNHARLTSPTLRVTDDGSATLPLALTGSGDAKVRVTALVLASGSATLPGARPLDESALAWGADGSTFAAARDGVLDLGIGAVWLRESASHDVLFEDVDVPHGTPISSLAAQYFRSAPTASESCIDKARAAGKNAGTLGRACALGALGRVPGGNVACEPTPGDVATGAVSCGDGFDDLAIALSGTVPGSATLTRFTGFVAQGAYGADLPIGTSSAFESPAKHAKNYAPCAVPTAALPATATQSTETVERPHHYRHDASGCSGSTTSIVFDDTGEEDTLDEDHGCGGTRTIHPAPATTETVESSSSSSSGGENGGGGNGAPATSSDSTGGDTSDSSESDSCGSSSNSPSNDDSCGSDSSSASGGDDSCGSGDSSSSSSSDSCGSGDSSSSSSSDSCGSGDSSSSSSSDSCGSGDSSSSSSDDSRSDCQIAGRGDRERILQRTRSASVRRRAGGLRGSPLSRFALLLAAIALPLRRRTRPRPAIAQHRGAGSS